MTAWLKYVCVWVKYAGEARRRQPGSRVVISWAQTSSSTSIEAEVEEDEEEVVSLPAADEEVVSVARPEEDATRRARNARQSVSTPATGNVSGTGEEEDEGRLLLFSSLG